MSVKRPSRSSGCSEFNHYVALKRLAIICILYCRLGVRLVLLVRDPRGILQSRKHREWCPSKPDCSDPALVCGDMVSDFSAAVEFSKKYPNSFRYSNEIRPLFCEPIIKTCFMCKIYHFRSI